MIKKLIKLVISLMVISWFAKKVSHHFGHDEKRMETMTSKLRRYVDR